MALAPGIRARSLVDDPQHSRLQAVPRNPAVCLQRPASYSFSNRSSVSPIRTTSPGRSSCWALTRAPFTYVPFVEFMSSM